MQGKAQKCAGALHNPVHLPGDFINTDLLKVIVRAHIQGDIE